jgi:hypothetical protein
MELRTRGVSNRLLLHFDVTLSEPAKTANRLPSANTGHTWHDTCCNYVFCHNGYRPRDPTPI